MLAKKLALPAHLALNQEQDMKLAPKLTLTSRENAQTINYAMLLIPIIGRKIFPNFHRKYNDITILSVELYFCHMIYRNSKHY